MISLRGIDDILRRSLTAFAEECLDGSWSGRREREAVSLYTFAYLLREINADGFLYDAAQVGLELPVPQIATTSRLALSGTTRGKRQVCKDVVIWPEPRMTCWDAGGNATVAPAAILEWKFGSIGIHQPDVDWLVGFAAAHPGFLGYAVTAKRPGKDFRLSCTQVSADGTEAQWLHIE